MFLNMPHNKRTKEWRWQGLDGAWRAEKKTVTGVRGRKPWASGPSRYLQKWETETAAYWLIRPGDPKRVLASPWWPSSPELGPGHVLLNSQSSSENKMHPLGSEALTGECSSVWVGSLMRWWRGPLLISCFWSLNYSYVRTFSVVRKKVTQSV